MGGDILDEYMEGSHWSEHIDRSPFIGAACGCHYIDRPIYTGRLEYGVRFEKDSGAMGSGARVVWERLERKSHKFACIGAESCPMGPKYTFMHTLYV